MKKILSLGVIGLMMAASTVNVQAKRLYFVLDGVERDVIEARGDVDYRLDDVNRVLYIWEQTLLGVPSTTPGIETSKHLNLKVAKDWWGCGFFLGPGAETGGNPEAEMDFSEVDETWYLHLPIKTDCATDITINLYGCTSDPDDPYVLERTIGKYILNKANFPLKERDKDAWKIFDIPMTAFFGQTGTAGGPLSYKAPLKKQNYLTFSGGNDMGSVFGIDAVYLTDKPSGVENSATEANLLKISFANDQLTVANAEETVEVYNACGALLTSSQESVIDMSGVAKGVYIAKSGNQVAKFIK